tara:strand:- start:3968 stop:5788 length:1821 start_codon:yes stop_codon:yes gene_type:complete
MKPLQGLAGLLLMGLLATPAGTVAQAGSTESARFNAWLDARFAEDLERSPMAKTRRGVIDDDYDEWDDLSPGFQEETYRIGQRQVDEMREQFDYRKLNRQAKLSWKLFEYDKARDKAGFPFREHVYTFNQMRGVQSQIPAFLINQHRIGERAHAEAYIDRLQGVDQYLGQALENARRRFVQDIRPPRFVYDHVLRDARNVIRGAPFDPESDENSPLLQDFLDKLDGIELDSAYRASLERRATQALRQHVLPAYQALIDEMTWQRERADERDGAWKLPDGDRFYAYRLAQSTTTGLSPDQVHDLGLRETARIHEEMRAIMAEVGFAGTLAEFFEFMRTDERFYYPDTPEGRERYLAEARAIIDDMRGRLDALFLRKPQADLVVKAVEPFRERSVGKAFYQRPAADGSRPGTYYANLYNMRDMPTYQMRALAYHEGIPGHHMQIAIAQELAGLPDFRRFGGHTAYVEGWGLYSEWVPAELGLYEDPYENFGRLAMELWRAGRLVVDTGLHAKRWTREQAIDWLLDNTPNPRGDVVKAIERYIVMPGQATAYKVGMLKIQALREEAAQALGPRFDVRDYHDVVLANGSVPLDILEELVDAYVARVSEPQ